MSFIIYYGMIISVIVKTRAKENHIEFDNYSNSYKVFVKTEPKEGKANREVEKLLSRKFRKRARIIKGFRSKTKLVELS